MGFEMLSHWNSIICQKSGFVSYNYAISQCNNKSKSKEDVKEERSLTLQSSQLNLYFIGNICGMSLQKYI